MNMESLDQIRMRAQNLAKRVRDDPAFKKRLQRDPEAELAASGIPEALMGEFLQTLEIEADVTGYIGPIKVPCVLSALL